MTYEPTEARADLPQYEGVCEVTGQPAFSNDEACHHYHEICSDYSYHLEIRGKCLHWECKGFGRGLAAGV
jgi:hypothetical protein